MYTMFKVNIKSWSPWDIYFYYILFNYSDSHLYLDISDIFRIAKKRFIDYQNLL